MEGHETASPRPQEARKKRKKRPAYKFIEPAGRGWRGNWFENGRPRKGKVFPVVPRGDARADLAAQKAAHEDAVAHRSALAAHGTAGSDVTLGQAAEMVRRRMVRHGRKPGTLRWFNDHVTALAKGFGLNAPLRLIDVHAVNRFIEQRQVGGKASLDGRFKSAGATPRKVGASTILKHLTALHRIFEVARSEGVTVSNPVKIAKKPPRPQWEEPSYFTWYRLQGCLAAIRASEDPSAAADADLIEFAFATGGMRRAEIARCMREDIGETELKIRGKKGGRSIPVCSKLRALVVRMLERSGGDSLLPGASERLRTELVVRTFKRWAKRLNMPDLRSHAIRHSVHPHLDEHGESSLVQDCVTGHRPVTASQRYKHAAKPRLRAAFEKLWLPPPDHLSQNAGSEPL